MAKLSGTGKGKWQNDKAFAKYKRKRDKARKQAEQSRRAHK